MLIWGGVTTFTSQSANIRATWAKKSSPNAPKVARQRDQGSGVCLVGSVSLASYGNDSDPSQVRDRSQSSDETYDQICSLSLYVNCMELWVRMSGVRDFGFELLDETLQTST